MLTRRCSLPSPQKVLTSLESAPLKVCNNAQFTENSTAYTVNAVHTHTLKRVPSQKCSLHYSVLTLIKVHSRTCSLHSGHCSPHPPSRKMLSQKSSPLSKVLAQKCSPLENCSPQNAHPFKSAPLILLTLQKVLSSKCSPLWKMLSRKGSPLKKCWSRRKVLTRKCSPHACQEVNTRRHCDGGCALWASVFFFSRETPECPWHTIFLILSRALKTFHGHIIENCHGQGQKIHGHFFRSFYGQVGKFTGTSKNSCHGQFNVCHGHSCALISNFLIYSSHNKGDIWSLTCREFTVFIKKST